ncbi:MAG: hypothetical protein Q8936_23645 [Bacillota bacterium]|nr:hypothetical protein [Bacillota bacterium]
MHIVTSLHLEAEDKFKLSEEKEAIGEVYRKLSLGTNGIIYGSSEAFEELFQVLDKQLHDTSYSELDRENIRLEAKVDSLTEENEELREIIMEIRRR